MNKLLYYRKLIFTSLTQYIYIYMSNYYILERFGIHYTKGII